MVVEILEFVDVRKEERKFALGSVKPRNFVTDLFADITTVRKLGELVGSGNHFEPVIGLGEFFGTLVDFVF